MQQYANMSGRSGVAKYEIGDDYITVVFKERNRDGCNTYVYTYVSTGVADVEHMKQLARNGVGLNAYISSYIKKRFASKY